MGRQQQQLCMVLMAFLVVSTMVVVHVAAGRALGQVSYGHLDPDHPYLPPGTPSVGPGQPYTTRGCRTVYECTPPAAAADTAAGGAP